MNIGVVVHSHTGNTVSVAEAIVQKLESLGHKVTLERIIADDENPQSSKPITLAANPDVTQYERLILAAPVRAFSLSPVMKTWLDNEPSLQGKSVMCFVTEHFPFAWMGGTRALHQFTKSCRTQGAIVRATAVINWSNKNRTGQIEQLVHSMAETFSA